MNALLEQFSEQHLVAFMLTLGRIAPLFLIAPLFSSKMIPARARGVAAVGIAIGFAPGVAAMPSAIASSPIVAMYTNIHADALTIGGLMIKEILVGIAFAFIIQC